MENNNIFEGAKFGDKFVTNDNRIAKFICITKITEDVRYCLYVENEQVPIWYDELGNNLLNKEKLNIVSRYQEPIDEEKLDKFAKKETGCLDPTNVDDPNYTSYHCYVAGYRKAKEE